MLTGQVKARLIEVLSGLVERHRRARALVTDEVSSYLGLLFSILAMIHAERYRLFIRIFRKILPSHLHSNYFLSVVLHTGTWYVTFTTLSLTNLNRLAC